MTIQEAVLSELESRKGKTVSGRVLADQLNVSRTAVWKAIEELRQDGYDIEAAPNRGYRLSPRCDRLSKAAIGAALPDALRERPLYVYDTLESTNQTVRQLALDGAPDGTIVLADHQTGGRGRKGRCFFSPPASGIYISVLLRTVMPAAQAVRITTAASVAVARAIESVTGISVQIKWINDLYLNDRKICGILTDGAINMENGLFEYAVVGIGLNVHTDRLQFPPELRETASSLYAETGVHTDRNVLAAAIIRELDGVWNEQSVSDYMAEYRARSCVLGHRIRVYGGGCDGEEAIALRINDDGHLIVRLDDGCELTLHSGEITIRPADAQGFTQNVKS